MRIAIDARMIRPGSMHGIARYVYHLLQQLRRIGQNHEIVILTLPNSPLLKEDWPAHMRPQPVDASWISFKEHWELPKVLREFQIDLFHAPSYVAPIMTPCRMVMTIHDLNHMVLPQFYTPLHQLYYQLVVRSCIKRSQYILTVSNFSKEEIVRNLGLPPEKVFVTYNGVSDKYRPITDESYLEYVRDLYELPDEFIFCLSNNKPHKNVHQLVRAFCHSSITIPLVLACPVDRNIIRVAENYGKKHLIYFTKFICDEHLPAVYSMTTLFVYPSTYEGFGLPPLEALSCGAPVVVARSSSLPEVVGDNAIFTNPFDYRAIANALEQGLRNSDLRDKLSRYGVTHAQRFSWQNMAEKTLAVYERAMGNGIAAPEIDAEIAK